MPTLDWIGKQAVVNHHQDVPFHLLRDVPELGCGPADSGNLIVEGDNLTALKALLPYYAGQVKCIYIDPPYNTGNEGWVYNDNVNSPEIKAWLGKVVGKEAEDLSRHDKWLCMMYPRLKLLEKFLHESGVCFISIGRDELASLRLLCDEVFGARNLIEILIWNTHGHTENQEPITGVHEYVLLYAKNKSSAVIRSIVDPSVPTDSKIRRNFAENSITKNGIKNPPSLITLPVGFPCEQAELELSAFPRFAEFRARAESANSISRELTREFDASYPLRADPMVVVDGKLVSECRVFTGWSSAEKLREFIRNGCIPIEDDGASLRFYLSKNGVIYYRREGRESHYVQSVLSGLGTTETNRYMLEEMGVKFDYPKPIDLVRYLLSLYASPGDLVLDSFAGSGTTGHASLNSENRYQFILVQQPYETDEQRAADKNLCKLVTATRVRAAVEGYTSRKKGEIPGLGGGFRYVQLGEPLFDATGKIRPTVRFRDLARHVFFTETGTPLPHDAPCDKPLLGVAHGVGVYLLYNGILKDKSVDGGNVLTAPILDSLPPHDGPRVIYGTACRIGPQRLKALGITFKQTPYAIKVR